MLEDYFSILIFILFAIFFSLTPIIICLFISPKKSNKNKLSPYECGSPPFKSAKTKINIRYYLIAILFIIFSLEIIFLFPFALILKEVSSKGFFAGMFFLFLLAIGFFYEWKKGALEWE